MNLWKAIRWKLVIFGARRLPPCCQIAHQISDSRQKRPSLRERIVIRLHLMVCDWCTSYSKQIVLIGDAARREKETAQGATSPEFRLSDSARERLRNSLKSDS
jgi:hypothetical protein